MTEHSRRAFLLSPIAMALLAACGDATPQPAFAPATDRPTFIFFYAQG